MAKRYELPRDWRSRAGLLFLAAVVVLGGLGGGLWVGEWVQDYRRGRQPVRRGRRPRSGRSYGRIPLSKLPGPPRTEKFEFRLNESNARRMQGTNDPSHERWCDISGNYYTREFVARFSYEDASESGPRVWVQVAPRAKTLTGRLEARGLKPNFAYQFKLFGDFSDRASFEIIGKVGRWRLPGWGTNYSDWEYADYPEARKHLVEAYVLFDYFVTDKHGAAVRDFALDSSLHVLWKASQYRGYAPGGDLLAVEVDAGDPGVYARPKPGLIREYLWAERESERYTAADQAIRLPPRKYRAFLVLTEESFHSLDTDGGEWATVCRGPVEFEISGR